MVNVYQDKREFKAMGCHMAAWLYADNEFAAEPLAYVETHFLKEEARLTRFDPQSELMRLNARPNEWVNVSDELWDLIQKGLELKLLTRGRFDVTMLNEIVEAGYNQSFEKLENEGASSNNCRNDNPIDDHRILFHPEKQMVQLPAGVQLDLGGIAKGYTAQSARDFLHPFGPCLIDAGGDLTAGDGPGVWPGWPVGIAAPWSAELGAHGREIGRIWLANSTLATSGIDFRRWQVGDEQAHHIIDPRTRRPVETDLMTVSVVHEDACRAEALATATLVMGFDAGIDALNKQKLPAVLIDKDLGIHLSDGMVPLFQPEVEVLADNHPVLDPL